MISYGERAIFCEENKERVRAIIEARGDLKKLAEVSPAFIILDLTWRCNYACNCCIDKNAVNKYSRELEPELIEDIFDYSHRRNVRGIMTMGGEVFLHREGIRKAMEKSIAYNLPLKTVSNGSCLEPHIDQIAEAYRIKGSMLRISINADKEHYREQTGGRIDLTDNLNTIKKITSKGTPIYVSTVVFPESSRQDGAIPNIKSLRKIIRYSEIAGIKSHIFLPARNTLNRRRYPLSNEEKEIIEQLKKGHYDLELEAGSFCRENMFKNQNLNFTPCPSGFIFTLIGSNGNVYKCSDNRGNSSMILGKIEKPGDFERFWHSEERVKRQIETPCQNKGCSRYKQNCLLDSACRLCQERGINMEEYFSLIDLKFSNEERIIWE